MPGTLGGPAIVLALVLAEVAIGGAIVLWVTPLWGRVRAGFYTLVGSVIAVTAILAWWAARAPLLAQRIPASSGSSAPLVSPADAPTSARLAVALLLAFAIMQVVWQVLGWFRARAAGRVVALLSLPVGIAALVALGSDPATSSSRPIAIFQLLAGAVFAGAVTDGLLLGHWHLVDRKLAREPIARMNQIFLGSAIAAGVAAFLGRGAGAGQAQESLSPLLGAGALATYLAVGLVGLCLTIGFFIRALIKENSIQAATGLFYLGVIMGLSAEFAAKVRFF